MNKKALLALLAIAALFLSGCGRGGNSNISNLGTGTTGSGGAGGTTSTPGTPAGSTTASAGTLGALLDLGDLLGASGDNWYDTTPYSINNADQVVGKSISLVAVESAFLWDPQNGMQFIPGQADYDGLNRPYDDYYLQNTQNPSTDFFQRTVAIKINDSGLLIGNSETKKQGETRGFVYDTNTQTFVDLTPWYQMSGTQAVMGEYSKAMDINSKGAVVLTMDTPDGKFAFFWDGKKTVDLANFTDPQGKPFPPLSAPVYLGLFGVVGQSSCEAVALNDNSQAIANCGSIPTFTDFTNGGHAVLNTLPGASSAQAVAINNQGSGRGHVVGNSGGQAFFWDGGAMYPLGGLISGGTSAAVGINDLDQVVGTATASDGSTHAVIWSFDNTTKQATIRDLGTLGGANSYAVAINNQGVVVGYSDTGTTYQEGNTTMGIQHAFLWKNGVMYDLGTHSDFYNYAFAPSYPFSQGVSINDNGELTGYSETINAHDRAFYLNPVFP